MLPNLDTLQEIKKNFLKELNAASQDKTTSLPYLINQLRSTPLAKEGEQFQIFGIGGSTFFNSLGIKKNEQIELTILKESSIHFQSGEEFLEFIDKELSDEISVLTINFAYPLEPIFEHEKLDGTLIANSKENDFTFLIGKKVGHEIEEFILKKRNKKIQVSIANDTVCLLLSGLTQFPYENLACGIVGTGLNFAYFLDQTHIVNLEAANFDKFSQTEEGKWVDQGSAHPGKALFEKETSGAYLFKHFNYHLQFDSTNYEYPPIFETKELSILSEQHVPQLSDLAGSLLKKSAAFVATQIAGITELKQKDMTFIMQGSLFWNGHKYIESVEEHIKQLIPNYTVSFVHIENSSLLGAAKLVS